MLLKKPGKIAAIFSITFVATEAKMQTLHFQQKKSMLDTINDIPHGHIFIVIFNYLQN